MMIDVMVMMIMMRDDVNYNDGNNDDTDGDNGDDD